MYNLFPFIKRILFPGLDIGTRKRMKFAKYFKGGDILTLDAGCGNGAFSFAACKIGNGVIGIDSDSHKLNRTLEFRDYLKIDPKRCDFKIHNIYNLLKLNQKFDQIICFETLEHIKDDEQAIKIFSEIMNEGGTLHLCVPYLNRKLYYGEIISETENGNHLRLGYTFEQLEEMIGKQGFKVLQKDTAVGFFAQKLINLLNWLQLNLFKKFSNRIRDGFNSVILIFLYPLTFLDKFIFTKPLNIYVAAQKILRRT